MHKELKADIKARAHYLLTCDELRGRLPEEVQAFLSDVVALEPVADVYNGLVRWNYPSCGVDSFKHGTKLYALGAPNDPA